MREPGAEPTEGEEPRHRGQKPWQAPLTHRMNLQSIRDAYWRSGLSQPELDSRRPERVDRQLTRREPNASNREPEERKLMNPDETTISSKPPVGGIQPQLHNARVQAVVSEGQKCLMYGGTAVLSGSILMLAWKGITRWLG